MNKAIQPADFKRISKGYNPNPSASLSLNAEAYTSPDWYASDVQSILAKSWQWVCHSEKVRKHGAYTTAQIAGQPIVVLRDKDGALRAFLQCLQASRPSIAGRRRADFAHYVPLSCLDL